jgi:hypothetical protein
VVIDAVVVDIRHPTAKTGGMWKKMLRYIAQRRHNDDSVYFSSVKLFILTC